MLEQARTLAHKRLTTRRVLMCSRSSLIVPGLMPRSSSQNARRRARYGFRGEGFVNHIGGCCRFSPMCWLNAASIGAGVSLAAGPKRLKVSDVVRASIDEKQLEKSL